MLLRLPQCLRTSWPLLLSACFGIAFYIACYFPGAMSFDSAVIWQQARGATSDNVHAVGLLWLWRATETVWSGPAPIFLIQLALFWSGLLSIAGALPWNNLRRCAFVLVAAFAPAVLVLLAHVWSDVMLFAALAFACGALLRYRETNGASWVTVFCISLFFALTLRHNALPAILPLIVYFVYLWRKQHASASRGEAAVIFAASCAATLVFAAAAALLDRQVDSRISAFPGTAMWDIAAVSLDADAILLPPSLHRPELALADLRNAYVPYANVPIFTQTQGRVIGPFFNPSDPRNADARDAWGDAIAHHPGAYLAHRWKVTQALFGSKPRDWPHELIYVDDEVQLGDNPPIAANRSALHIVCMRTIEALRDTFVLAAWPYLALALAALTLAWRRRARPNAQAAIAVLCSGLLYAAPLPLIAPSAELRYLGWSCLSAIIGAALALTAAHRGEAA